MNILNGEFRDRAPHVGTLIIRVDTTEKGFNGRKLMSHFLFSLLTPERRKCLIIICLSPLQRPPIVAPGRNTRRLGRGKNRELKQPRRQRQGERHFKNDFQIFQTCSR